jgi:hypothetical protein
MLRKNGYTSITNENLKSPELEFKAQSPLSTGRLLRLEKMLEREQSELSQN